MLDSAQLASLMRRIHGGDQQAAAEFVLHFEPYVLREIRLRLEDRHVRSAFDSADVSQSVLASFFVRAAVGEFDLDDPYRLIGLLVSIARRKVVSLVRREHRLKRDVNRIVDTADERLQRLASADATPSAIIANQELLERAMTILSDEERSIAQLRREDCSWDEVARRLGGTSAARRVQLARAMKRVIEELDIGTASA